MVRKGSWFLGLLLVTASPGFAQQVTLHGQVRPRYEFRDPAPDGRADEFISMRVRAGIEAALANDIAVFIQLQDVRLWGEETGTASDFSADNFDLHQGWLTVSRLGGSNAWLRVGRQESPLGNERLVGTVDWLQQAQSFDGVRLGTTGSWGEVSAIAFKIAEETAGATDDLWLFGGFATLDAGGGDLAAFGFYERTRGVTGGDQATVGGRYERSLGRVDAAVEGALQFGTRGAADVAAFLFAAHAGADVTDRLRLTLWWDYLSGDADPTDDDVRVFSTLFATNHKYYGYADLFTNIPVHTAGRGLQDFALKATFAASERVGIDADLHAFRFAEQRRLSSARVGEELDLTLRWTVRPGLGFTGGYTRVFHAAGLSAINRLTEDMDFAYAMLNVAF